MQEKLGEIPLKKQERQTVEFLDVSCRIISRPYILPGIPGCLGRFGRKKEGAGQMKNGAVTGSISQIETRLRLSPAVDSSQPTCSQTTK